MNLVQLTGRQHRLKRELSIACGEVPQNAGRIERLTDELASTAREIAAARAAATSVSRPVRVQSSTHVASPPSTHAWLGSFAGRLLQLRPSMSVGSAVRYAVMSIHHAAALDPRRAAELLAMADPVSTAVVRRRIAVPRDAAGSARRETELGPRGSMRPSGGGFARAMSTLIR